MVQAAIKKAKDSEAAAQIAKQAPVLVLFVIMAGGFLYAQERRDQIWRDMVSKDEHINALRIDDCHRVQSEANAAMEKVAEALNNQSRALEKLSWKLGEGK